MNSNSKIYIAGHKGMVGSAIWKFLERSGFNNLVGFSSAEADLRDSSVVKNIFDTERPQFVFMAAAKVGGIVANNTYRGEFLLDNLLIQNNIIKYAHEYAVQKLLFLGSSCIYPKYCEQPIKEEYLLTGPLEYTNEPYAVAKIAGIKLCENFRSQYGSDFISVMPSNLYGIGDNYHPENSHVLPALIRKFHFARENDENQVELWGDGTPMREFLFSEDLAEACVFLMENYSDQAIINVGSGTDLSIADLAEYVMKIVGFSGEIKWNTEMPNGTPRKLLDVSRINDLGWKAKTDLNEGIMLAYQDFLARHI